MQGQQLDTEPGHLDGSAITDQTVVARSPAVGYVELDGDGVCYDPIAGEMHLFNTVATVIWSCLDGQGSLAEIAADIAAAFAADESTVRDNVVLAVSDFADKGLITAPQGGDRRAVPDTPPPTSASPRLLTDPPSR